MSAELDLPVVSNLDAIRGRLHALRGKQFWRSLDELAQSNDFRELVEREFPSQLPRWDDPLDRRNFLRLMGASMALAGLAGCTRPPQEQIVPSVQYPDGAPPGTAMQFASAHSGGGYGVGVLVKSYSGRPTKIEGNPLHPASLGATDVFAQASILDLYDPDRSQTIVHRGVISTWDHFLTAITDRMKTIRERRGAGLRVLTETITSPTLGEQLLGLLDELPEARWHQYEPASLDNIREGCRLAFGRYVDPRWRFDRADIVLALDANFLIELPGSLRYARHFIDRRRVAGGNAGRMNRLYALESTPTLTGAMADHRLPLRPTQMESLARNILNRIRPGDAAENQAAIPGIPEKWLTALVQDLRSSRRKSIVVAGPGPVSYTHLTLPTILRV